MIGEVHPSKEPSMLAHRTECCSQETTTPMQMPTTYNVARTNARNRHP